MESCRFSDSFAKILGIHQFLQFLAQGAFYDEILPQAETRTHLVQCLG
jgi:hypothetical protein